MEESLKEYFKSEEHMIVFALVYTDMSLREKILGISEDLYENADKAKEWRNAIAKKIHPDHCKLPDVNLAAGKLNELYSRMIEKDGESDE